MTSSEFIAQFIVIGALVFFIGMAWRNVKRAAKDFSALWSTDPAAKQLSLVQLLLAITTKSSFSQQSKDMRACASAAVACICIVIVMLLQGKQIHQLTIHVIDSTPVGGKVIFTEQDMEHIRNANQETAPSNTSNPTP